MSVVAFGLIRSIFGYKALDSIAGDQAVVCSTTTPVFKARDITNVLPTKVNSFHCSYVESVSSVGGRLCVLMAISDVLNASLASRWRRIIRLITCSARGRGSAATPMRWRARSQL